MYFVLGVCVWSLLLVISESYVIFRNVADESTLHMVLKGHSRAVTSLAWSTSHEVRWPWFASRVRAHGSLKLKLFLTAWLESVFATLEL